MKMDHGYSCRPVYVPCYDVHGALLNSAGGDVLKCLHIYMFIYLHFEEIWWATGIVLDYEKYICRPFVGICHYEEHILH